MTGGILDWYTTGKLLPILKKKNGKILGKNTTFSRDFSQCSMDHPQFALIGYMECKYFTNHIDLTWHLICKYDEKLFLTIFIQYIMI